MIEIRQMTIDDLSLGLRLTQQAGWNQTESDWLRFMNLEPTGCFVAELDGYSVGTTTTCIFGGTPFCTNSQNGNLGQVAWISMVLVDVNARGKGVGTELLKHSLTYLDKRKAITTRLDATSAGQPIYEKLGFVAQYELARFEGIAPPGRIGPVVTKATSKVFTQIIDFDKRMTGTDRTKMLSRLFEEFPQYIRILQHGDTITGFATMRPGANAIQIGPCIATTNAGPALLSDALNRCAGEPVFVDIPLDNADAVKIAESSGLKIQRYFMRMYRGQRVKDNIKALWASSGPEKG